MCGCFDNCGDVSVICVLLFTVFLHCFVFLFLYVYLFLFVTSVSSTATERKLNSSK